MMVYISDKVDAVSLQDGMCGYPLESMPGDSQTMMRVCGQPATRIGIKCNDCDDDSDGHDWCEEHLEMST